jgi:hypothetical protein
VRHERVAQDDTPSQQSSGIMRLPSPYACEIGIDAICVSDASMPMAATMCSPSATICASVVSVAFTGPVDPDVSFRIAAPG